jgi:two-component system CheB/CheR fusion protein
VIAKIDEARLAQVLRNLLLNAVRVTPKHGTIIVRITQDGKTLKVEVQDTSPGLSKECRRSLFKEESLLNDAFQVNQGAGVGMLLSQRIMEMHTGSLGVDMDWEGQVVTINIDTIPTVHTIQLHTDLCVAIHRVPFSF